MPVASALTCWFGRGDRANSRLFEGEVVSPRWSSFRTCRASSSRTRVLLLRSEQWPAGWSPRRESRERRPGRFCDVASPGQGLGAARPGRCVSGGAGVVRAHLASGPASLVKVLCVVKHVQVECGCCRSGLCGTIRQKRRTTGHIRHISAMVGSQIAIVAPVAGSLHVYVDVVPSRRSETAHHAWALVAIAPTSMRADASTGCLNSQGRCWGSRWAGCSCERFRAPTIREEARPKGATQRTR